MQVILDLEIKLKLQDKMEVLVVEQLQHTMLHLAELLQVDQETLPQLLHHKVILEEMQLHTHQQDKVVEAVVQVLLVVIVVVLAEQE